MIRGTKVRLRPIEVADLPALVNWLNDPEISRLVGGWSFPVSLAEQELWFRRSLEDRLTKRWIVETSNGERIGLTGLWNIDWQARNALTALKIGNPEFRGQGYGPDAIMTVMAFAFHEVGLRRLWSEVLPYNKASYRAYVEKCGWKVEGVLRQHVYRGGRYSDQLRIGILREEFELLPNSSQYAAGLANRPIGGADVVEPPEG